VLAAAGAASANSPPSVIPIPRKRRMVQEDYPATEAPASASSTGTYGTPTASATGA
jgi:hypothetical protein